MSFRNETPYLTVDQFMSYALFIIIADIVRPIIKEEMTNHIIERKCTLSPFIQQVWKREFQFRSNSSRDQYIQDKLEFLTHNDLLIQEPKNVNRESTVKTIGLLSDAQRLHDETQKFSFQRRYQNDSQTGKLNKMQHYSLLNSDPNNQFWSNLDPVQIDEERVKTQGTPNPVKQAVIQHHELDDPIPMDSNMVKLRSMIDEIPTPQYDAEWEPLRQHYRAEGLNCMKSQTPISRLVTQRERIKQQRKDQLQKIDRVLQGEILHQMGREAVEQPLYLSRNMGLRSQNQKHRPRSRSEISTPMQNNIARFSEINQHSECGTITELRINTRGRKRLSSVQNNVKPQQEERDSEAVRIYQFIENQLLSPPKHSFWVNKRRTIGYTSRNTTRQRNPKQVEMESPSMIKRKCRTFKLSEVNTNAWTNHI